MRGAGFQFRDERLFSEELAIGIARFDQAIGIKQQAIARFNRH